MNKRIMTVGVSTILLGAALGLGGCQSQKPTATTRPIGAVPASATNDQGNQAAPPVIHFNQSDHN